MEHHFCSFFLISIDYNESHHEGNYNVNVNILIMIICSHMQQCSPSDHLHVN